MKIFDLHNDFFTEIRSTQDIRQYIKSINSKRNVSKVCSVVWTTKLRDPIRFLKNIYSTWFLKEKKISKKLLLCIEDLGFINQNNYYEAVNLLKKINPLYCGLCWNYDNTLCGGAFGKRGISELGKKLILDLERLNIQVDTAHMNKRSFFDFLKITTRPILCSHTNFCKFKENKRNLTKKQIEAIVNSNGIIGLCFVKDFISSYEIDSKIISGEVKYFFKIFGESNLSIGSDFYGTKYLPVDIKSYEDFSNLYKSLKQIKIKKHMAKKVFSLNALEFFKTCQKH